MSREILIVDGRSPSQVARAHGISRGWIYELLGRVGRDDLADPQAPGAYLPGVRIR